MVLKGITVLKKVSGQESVSFLTNSLHDVKHCLKLPFLFINLSPKNTQMTTFYSNLLLYITFTVINYIRQE